MGTPRFAKDNVNKGDTYLITNGKYKGKVGIVHSTANKSCRFNIDEKITGNIKYEFLEEYVGSNNNINNRSQMETPSRVLSKRKSSNTIKKQVEVGEKGKFKKTAAATSKILEAAEIANRIINNIEDGEFKEYLDVRHFKSQEANKTLEDFHEAVKPRKVHVGVSGISNKIVVFSTWKEVLSQAQVTFKNKINIDCSLRIDGDVTASDRMKIIEKFNKDDSPQVIFCQIDTCGAGINLQTANVVFILDPKWSPALEWQARDRIWRLGSPHTAVYFYHFRVKVLNDEMKKAKQDEKEKIWEETVGIAEDTVDIAEFHTYRSRSNYASLKREFDVEILNAGINATLKNHQFTGVRWMQRQERGENPGQRGIKGGILADDMGLGKTLQLLTLIKLDLNQENKPTLVVMPKTVFNSWIDDCKKFIPGMKVIIYHGDFHTKSNFPTVDTIMRNAGELPTIVLTNYHRLRDNSAELMTIDWRRLILDESHAINNMKNGFDNACQLKCDFKWSATGTPMKNKISDFSAHLQLIGADKKNIEDTDMRNVGHINSVLLRRTKLALKSQGEKLPKCFINAHQWQSLTENEKIEYKRKESGWHFLAQFSKGSICTGVLENVNNSENVNNYNKSDSELDVKVDAATTLFDPRFNTDSEGSDGL